jgi:hypothetical protein
LLFQQSHAPLLVFVFGQVSAELIDVQLVSVFIRKEERVTLRRYGINWRENDSFGIILYCPRKVIEYLRYTPIANLECSEPFLAYR